ncbi:MAG: hypothetical protein Q9166_000721 [cf. Caloplaca sp. 2 TL-2023]
MTKYLSSICLCSEGQIREICDSIGSRRTRHRIPFKSYTTRPYYANRGDLVLACDDYVEVADYLKQPASSNEPKETDFETFYLKQVTTEFADDLDKLRSASDFSEKSVPILIDALKGTARTYSEEEKAKAMGHSR